MTDGTRDGRGAAVPTTAAEARAVIWQGGPDKPRLPMGELLDAGRLTAKDLEWAAARHFNPRVKTAAPVLLAELRARRPLPGPSNSAGGAGGGALALPSQMNGAASSAPGAIPAGARPEAEVPRAGYAPRRPGPIRGGGPEVRRGSRFLEEQMDEANFWMGVAGGLVAASLGWATLILLSSPSVTSAQQAVLGFLLALAGGTILGWRALQRWATFGRGRGGEEAVVDALRSALSGEWVIFWNLVLPDKQGDLDVVLVGRGGVWVLEVKAFRATVRVRMEQGKAVWELRRGAGWQRMRENPSGQVEANAKRLRKLLRAAGLDVGWVSTGR